MKPVIAVLGPASSPHLANWIAPIADQFEVHVISTHAPHSRFFDRLKVEYHPLSPVLPGKIDYFFQGGAVSRIMRKTRARLLHAHYLSSYGIMGALSPTDTPKLLSVWGSDLLERGRSFLFSPFLRNATSKYQWINLPAQHLAGTLHHLSPHLRAKIDIFQYPIDIETVPFRTNARKSGDVFKIASIRHWDPIYRIDLIIEGFKSFLKTHPQSELHLFGGGDKEQTRKITALAAGEPRVKIEGNVSAGELRASYKNFDAFVSIPWSDGLPLSVVEALAANVYPVLGDIPANRELLQSTPFEVFPLKTAADVATALERAEKESFAAETTDLRRAMESRADKRFFASHLQQVYREALNGSFA